jgi:hypothetical protein
MAERRRPQDFSEWPLSKKVLMTPLLPIVFLSGFVVLMLILLPVAIWNGIVYLIYWVRYKFTGKPIPPKAPLPPN